MQPIAGPRLLSLQVVYVSLPLELEDPLGDLDHPLLADRWQKKLVEFCFELTKLDGVVLIVWKSTGGRIEQRCKLCGIGCSNLL